MINRKTFLKSTSLLLGGVLVGANRSFANLFQDHKNGLKILRGNVGIYTERGGTIGWFISDDASVVIDTQFPDNAKNFMEGFKLKTSRNIDILFNTHHHRDHTAGNYFLKDFAGKIVAHENCPKYQELQQKGTENEKTQVYADTTFLNDWEKSLGLESVNAKHFGPAHTGGDIIIHFENDNIAHMGDLVFNRTYPFIDPNGGGKISGWIEVLEKAAEHYSSDTLFIFGHADDDANVTGKKDALINMKNYLEALTDFVKKEKSTGKPLEEIKKTKYLDNFSHLKERWAGAFAANIEAAYNEID
jgi:cyclase